MHTPLRPPPPMPERDRRALTRERYALAILAGFATRPGPYAVEKAVEWADALMGELGRRYAEDVEDQGLKQEET
jgi:hypothetical protein